jgi:hypothetical protein
MGKEIKEKIDIHMSFIIGFSIYENGSWTFDRLHSTCKLLWGILPI